MVKEGQADLIRSAEMVKGRGQAKMEERPEIHYLQYGLLAACFRVRIEFARSQITITRAMICNQQRNKNIKRGSRVQNCGEKLFFFGQVGESWDCESWQILGIENIVRLTTAVTCLARMKVL